MAKEGTYYFTHDYNARTDAKIKKMLVKWGMAGYGVYFSIIEDLYNNANALPTHYDSIAYDLRADENMVKSVICDFDLFVIEGNIFFSHSVQRRLNDRNQKSEKARISALNRWNKNAFAMRSQCERIANASKSDAIKERKGKEIKEKDREESEREIPPAPFYSFSVEQLKKFYGESMQWKEKVCMNRKMKIPDLDDYFQRFLAKQDEEMRTHWNNLQDASTHFTRWMDLEIKNTLKKSKYDVSTTDRKNKVAELIGKK